VLRRKFGPKRDEVTGEWRKLHNEELNDLQAYFSTSIVLVITSRMIWVEHVANCLEARGLYSVLGKISGKESPLGRPRGRW
jgi:hypothetical protein